MQTNFTEKQLKDSDNAATEKIFKKCVHCGFCNATCPTHQINKWKFQIIYFFGYF